MTKNQINSLNTALKERSEALKILAAFTGIEYELIYPVLEETEELDQAHAAPSIDK